MADCAECGEDADHRNHHRLNRSGHFFNSGEPVISDRVAAPKTRAAIDAAAEWLRPRVPRQPPKEPEPIQSKQPITNPAFERISGSMWPSTADIIRNLRKVLSVAEGPLSVTELTAAVHAKRQHVYNALVRMAEGGEVVCFFGIERVVDRHRRKTLARLSRWWPTDSVTKSNSDDDCPTPPAPRT